MRSFGIIALLTIFILKSLMLSGQSGQWTWVKGDSAVNSMGHYGVKGVAAPSNRPPGLYEPNGWVDQQGNFWLFGGTAYYGNYSDLWKYDLQSGYWTWMHGQGMLNQAAVYGIQGVPSAANTPGQHHGLGFITWVDQNNDLWLMGGSLANGGTNDLWRYHIPTNEWTWMHGSKVIGDMGHFGTFRTSDPANMPPGRDEVRCGWTDDDGNLWLFGGANGAHSFNDLWKYNINTNQWAWMHGSDLPNQPGLYGTQYVPGPDNTPGARWPYAHWKDSDGNFWIFGGGNAFYDVFNDLWRFDPQSLEWTWMSGPSAMNQAGHSHWACQPDVDNIPVCRYENSACWKGACDVFYGFGGRNPRSVTLYSLGDLWCYDRFSGEWTYVKGDSSLNTLGHHGNLNVPDEANLPRALFGSTAWTDTWNNFWMYGGRNIKGEFIAELWQYVPDAFCPPGNIISSATVSADTVICKGESVMLTATGGNSYHWTPHYNISNPYSHSPSVSPAITTTYAVDISYKCNSETSSSTTRYVTVEVKDCEPLIPNVFTPNGDGRNDTFLVSYEGNMNYSIFIYNRWGILLFQSDQLATPWDGTVKGNDTPDGVYFYVINIGSSEYKGTLSIVR